MKDKEIDKKLAKKMNYPYSITDKGIFLNHDEDYYSQGFA